MLAERAISVPPAHPPHPRAEAITDLRAAIDRIERRSLDVRADSHIVGLGDDGIDAALPWGGLPRGALHEVVAGDAGAGLGFVATLLGRLAAAGDGRGQRVLWCLPPAGLYETGNLYAPALAAMVSIRACAPRPAAAATPTSAGRWRRGCAVRHWRPWSARSATST